MKVKELITLLSRLDPDMPIEWHSTHGKVNTPVINGETYHTNKDALVINDTIDNKAVIAVTEHNVKGGYWND